jgi:O-acetylhomoserine (thiol)-lyase
VWYKNEKSARGYEDSMTDERELGFETAAIHAGQIPDPATLSRGVAVHRTSSFVFKSTEHAANLFALKELGNIYSRLGNPTNAVLEDRMTVLEGGVASVAAASGTAAIFNTIVTIARVGDEIVSASNLYGGTYTLFDAIFPDLGITTRFGDIRVPASFEKLIGEKTRLIYLETIGNPTLDVADIPAFAEIARKHHLPLVVDNTFATPYLLRPIELGANIVVNSLTKWIGGHGSAIGGIVTDGGNFDWTDPKFSLFNQPDKNYHGLRWARDLGPDLGKMAFALRNRTVPLRNIGACLSPDNAWIFLQGLESLHVRLPRHSENALAVAKHLSKHPKASWIRYPGLESDPTYPVAKRLLAKGFGGMIVFGVKGGRAAGEKLIESLELFSHLANVGDAKSLALHPASTSHSQLSDDQQKESGLTPDLVRLSIGLENLEDIIADLDQALAKI